MKNSVQVHMICWNWLIIFRVEKYSIHTHAFRKTDFTLCKEEINEYHKLVTGPNWLGKLNKIKCGATSPHCMLLAKKWICANPVDPSMSSWDGVGATFIFVKKK